jgi:Flp pilus assembly protein TadB
VIPLSADLVYALLAGALVGLGLLLLVLAVRPSRVGIAAGIARLDADRQAPRMSVSDAILSTEGLSDWRLRLGSRVAAALAARGLRVQSLRADLAVLGRSLEGFLASTVLFAVLGLLLGPLLVGAGMLVGVDLGLTVPLGLALLFALLCALLPLAAVRREAARRRQDFRHAVGAFLDLVSMNLAGGRGVPEALSAAASIGGGWPFARLRDTLAFARLQGLTPWAALGRLGDEVGLNELRDLSAALTLVADDGAKIRASLAARAATLRRRELAEMEGKAGQRSQSMLVAQMLIVMGYLLFLGYPAVSRIL